MAGWNFDEIRRSFEADLARGRASGARAHKRSRILAAATEAFVAHGYRKTSVEEVARAAGVAKGTIYLYFKTKADMLMAALDVERRRYAAEILPLFREEVEPRERLRGYVERTLRLAAELPLFSRLQGGDRELLMVLDELDTSIRSRTLEVGMDLLVRLIDDAASPHTWSPSELRDRATVLMGILLAGGGRDEVARLEMAPNRFARVLAEVIVDGLAGKPH